MDNTSQPTPAEYALAQQFLDQRVEGTFRWGSRMLRGPQKNFNPCVLDRTGWYAGVELQFI